MFDFSFPVQGLELGEDLIRTALLSRSSDGIEVQDLRTHARSTEARPFQQNPPPTDAFWVSALPCGSTLSRPLLLQLHKERDIDSVLPFEAEPLLPYPSEQACLDKVIVSQDEAGSRVTLLATRTDLLERHLELCHELGAEPEQVSCAAAALANLNPHLAEGETPRFLLHIGPESLSCALVEGDRLRTSLDRRGGISTLIDKLATATELSLGEARKKLSSKDFDPAELPEITQALTEIERWIHQATQSMRKSEHVQERCSLILLGDGATIPLVERMVRRLFEGRYMPVTPRGLSGVTEGDILHYALPIGLALGPLEHGRGMVNLRQGDFAYPRPWRRQQKALGVFVGLALILSLLIHLWGQSLQSRALTELSQDLAIVEELTAQFNEGRDEVAADAVTLEFQTLSEDQISQKLGTIQEGFDAQSGGFPLQPTTPRVSDFLAWLGSHPALRSEAGEDAPSLQLESVHFTMTKRPQQGKLRDRYSVKVDLELSGSDTRDAREFHDSLLEASPMVDTKQAVNWSSPKAGQYRTTFMLKSRSPR